MATLKQRHDPVKLFGRRLILLVLLMLVIFGMFGVWNIFVKDRESSILNQQAQAQLTDMTQRKTQLSSNIASLQTERGVEAALRQQYALGKQGEGMIVIISPPTPAPLVATSSPFKQWIHDTFPWW